MKYESLPQKDSELYALIEREQVRQREQLQMIPSENYASKAVLEPLSSVLSNKYSEGYPGRRYYQGNEIIDEVENLAKDRAKALFGAEYVNVQPFSGSPANIATYLALLQDGDTILAMNLASGGHLSHGSPVNISSKLFHATFYDVDKETQRLDYDQVRETALKVKPALIVAGASAYPRKINFKRFREIADEVGAIFMADIAHIAGLIAGGVHESPVPYADVVTTTTHKTLRGPRGAIIMAKEKYSKQIDRMVFPGGIQAGPHNHVHAAKAVCFYEASLPEFRTYSEQIVANAKKLAEELSSFGFELISGGTDNHLLLVDLRNKGVGGKPAAIALEAAGIILNYNMIPYDTSTPFNPSGIRLGTPAITSRGMTEEHMPKIASWINTVIDNYRNEELLTRIASEVKEFASQFPVPGLDD